MGLINYEEAEATIAEITDERKLMRNTMLKIIHSFLTNP